MAHIQVNERWRIASYSHGWSAQRAKQAKNKDTGLPETVYVAEMFYATFDQAVSGIAKALLRESEATDITELMRDAHQIANLLDGLRSVDKEAE